MLNFMNSHHNHTPKHASIYLCAPVNALVEGIYEENIPLEKVRKHGDFGLGTFNDLDGEMIMIDGQIYQIPADGRVQRIDHGALTPFACVTFFQPSIFAESERELAHDEFLSWISSLLPSPNLFYAIRIDGAFAHIKARSVPKQANYRPLVEVAKEQHVFNFYDVEGTLAGFNTPSFMASINVPGLHLHFLSTDQCEGGHLLECYPRNVRVAIQPLHKLELSLPMSQDYLAWDFQRDIAQDLGKAEK